MMKSPIQNLHLTSTERQVITAGMLGDGGREGKSTFAFTHGSKQKEYFDYKANLLQRIQKGEASERTHPNGSKSYRFRSYGVDEAAEIMEKWYTGKQRVVPRDLEITPLMLALWFFDDGCRKGKSYGTIATCAFSKEDVQFLSDLINKTFGLTTWIFQDRKYWLIKLDAENDCFEKLCVVVKPYLVDCMRYKMPQRVTTKWGTPKHNQYYFVHGEDIV